MHTNLEGEILALPKPDAGDRVVAVHAKDAHYRERVAHHFLEPLVHPYTKVNATKKSNSIKIVVFFEFVKPFEFLIAFLKNNDTATVLHSTTTVLYCKSVNYFRILQNY